MTARAWLNGRASGIAVALLLLPAVVLAQDASQKAATQPAASAKVSWQMTTEYPQSNISGVGLTTFARLVAARTDGFVTVTASFDNALKISSGEMLRATETGRISGGDAFAGPLEASDPIFGLASLPFVVQSVEAARTVNAKARPLYEKALAAHGSKLLYMTIWPSTGLWSERALVSTDDLRTLAVRTYDYNSAEVMRAAGARADYLPFNDAIAKVRDHQLNAILTSGDGGAGRKLWDYLRHFTPINYAVPISLAFIRTDAFQALPNDVQAEVMAAAAETEKSQFDLLANRTAENYAQMRANGVTIADSVPSSIATALREAAHAPVDAWKAKVGAEAAAIVDGAGRH
ncbi:TRAP transporter substrate-binding protein [Bradyrhizobium sp. NP1]|uniref:TRAP transporter substrate-binding protein n=1 Tax=Bradyrhizobium sp. NP1 TaxID=3049772 RepID=UPI0025A57DD4|nr:TRAP transporter substrate-binding protein [Bradyrhizobium sp. NP1]WJR79037.1 TRAP transporter substrate-binding protein [Bradyrhizobium sp. NP1]